LPEFGEVGIARDDEMRSGSACQGDEIIIAGVGGESGFYLRIALNGAYALKQSDVGSNLGCGYVGSEFRA
jgi:hypothetical protein